MKLTISNQMHRAMDRTIEAYAKLIRDTANTAHAWTGYGLTSCCRLCLVSAEEHDGILDCSSCPLGPYDKACFHCTSDRKGTGDHLIFAIRRRNQTPRANGVAHAAATAAVRRAALNRLEYIAARFMDCEEWTGRALLPALLDALRAFVAREDGQ